MRHTYLGRLGIDIPCAGREAGVVPLRRELARLVRCAQLDIGA